VDHPNAIKTKKLLSIIRRVPYFFPKRARAIAQHSLEETVYGRDRGRESASFFNNDVSWKAISIVVQLTESELNLIYEWTKHSNNIIGFNAERDRESFKVNFEEGNGSRHIGWINFKRKDSITNVLYLECPETLSNSCYVTISKFSAGLTYLSLYFMLSDDATKYIKNLDVSHIKPYCTLQTFNPMSRRFGVMEHYYPDITIRSLLKDNFNRVCEDTKDTAQKILKFWKIKKKAYEFVLVADFFRDSEKPYFNDELSTNPQNQYIQIQSRDSYYDNKVSNDDLEHYCLDLARDGLSVDAIFIKNQNTSAVGKNDDFSNIGLEIHDSHLVYSTIIDLYKRYKTVAESVNKTLISRYKKPEKNHDILFQSSIELDVISQHLKSILSSLHFHCDSKYEKFAHKWVEHWINVTSKFNEVISSRRRFSSDSLQVENLRFNRKYSWWVGVLVIVQIILACFSINWDSLLTSVVNKYQSIYFKQHLEEQLDRSAHVNNSIFIANKACHKVLASDNSFSFNLDNSCSFRF